MLSVEFEKTVRCIMTLIEKDVLPVPYRSGTTLHLPLTDIKGMVNDVNFNQRTNGPVNAHLSLLHIPINIFEYYGI